MSGACAAVNGTYTELEGKKQEGPTRPNAGGETGEMGEKLGIPAPAVGIRRILTIPASAPAPAAGMP
ncbi:hypothetical protein FRC06_010998, partial [Ceratobasidium sp. 370]